MALGERGTESGGTYARAGLTVGLALQPVIWAAGRWGVLGEAGGAIRELDREALAWMAEHGSSRLDTLFGAVTHLGSLALAGPLALLLGVGLAWRKRTAQAWFVLGAFFGAALFAQVGKLLVARPRPEGGTALVEMPSDLSFPSAHTTQAAALALALWLVTAGMPPGRRTAVAIGAAAAVGLVALSRVYLQVHYPTDVVAGMLGAAAWVGGLGLAAHGRP